MSKRLITLITISMMILVVFSAAQAQETPSGEPVFVLTEEQINEEFRIPNTATRTFSNVEVDVQEDGVHISFQMTTIKDGTTNTMGIIAVLIGLLHGDFSTFETNVMSSSGVITRYEQRQINALVLRAWRNYMGDVAEANGLSLFYERITWLTTSFSIDIGTSEN